MENQYSNGINGTKRLPDFGVVNFNYEARARELRKETWQAIGRSVANAVRRLWTAGQAPRSKRLTPSRAC
jgi:hypothetical protein